LAVAERTHELRVERDRTHAILEALGEAVVVIDGQGMIQYVNPAFVTLSGYTREEALGQDVLWWEAIHQPGGPMAQVIEAVCAECVWSGEVVGRRKDGTLYDAMVTVAPFGDPEHPQVSGGFVSVSRDITPLKEADRLKDQFVSNVSHELRTPLSVIAMIAGNLDLFYRRLGDDQRQAMIRDLRAQARLLSDLIGDILEISRMDSQRMAPEFVLLNLAELARTEADEQRSLAEGKRQTLSVIYADELVVRGNERQLRQVIRNLLNNAVKYMPDGGQIVCECQRLGNGASSAAEWPGHESLPARLWAAVRVADTGIGIPAEHLPHIFERFYRVQPQGSVPGTGLGLAIVKELVERHGGYVGVASTPGKGSVLALYLPIAEQE
jgi:PAS domain S-box-containing protein